MRRPTDTCPKTKSGGTSMGRGSLSGHAPRFVFVRVRCGRDARPVGQLLVVQRGEVRGLTNAFGLWSLSETHDAARSTPGGVAFSASPLTFPRVRGSNTYRRNSCHGQ